MHQERCARRAAWDFSKIIYRLKNTEKLRFNSYWSKDNAGTYFKKKPEEREFVVNSEASMHMMRKKTYAQMNWILCEDPGTLCLLTANGEVHKRGSRSIRSLSWSLRDSASTRLNACCFYRLELCGDHGYSCEWVSGQKTKGDQRGEDDFMQNGQLRTSCCSRNFSTSSGGNSSSTSTSQDLSSTSPAQERSGELAPRVWCGSPSETLKKKEKEGWQSRCGQPFSRSSWMVGGGHR